MSAARRQRRQAELADRRTAKRLKRHLAKPITAVADGAGAYAPDVLNPAELYEQVHRGDHVFVTLKVPPDAPDAVKASIARHREAFLTGDCSCGGALVTAGRSPNTDAVQVKFQHAAGCDGSDEVLEALCRLYDWRPA